MLKKFASVITIFVSLMLAPWAMAAVEINTADQAQLDSVAGIGPSTSRAILEERKKNGSFKDWADLERRVRGIGERNSVKLSAAGLLVNGQQHSATSPADKAVRPVNVAKTGKDTKKDIPKDTPKEANGADEKDVRKGGDTKR